MSDTPTSVLRTPNQFINWLLSLKLPHSPRFNPEDDMDYLEFKANWIEAFQNEGEASFEAMKYYLAPTLKKFPTIPEVLEVLAKVKMPPRVSVDKLNEYWKFKGKDLYPGFRIATDAQVEAIKKHLPRTSDLPKINLETGRITIDGKGAGNISEYEIDARLKKLKEKKK